MKTKQEALTEIHQLYKELDKKFGIDTSNIEVTISSKYLSSFGCCYSKTWIPYKITIAAFLLDYPEELIDTAKHEWSHACVLIQHPGENHGHDEIWKQVCNEIGCNPSRCAELPKELEEKRKGKQKYIVVCQQCKCQCTYYRKTKVVKNIMDWMNGKQNDSGCHCRKCGGKTFDLVLK